MIDVKIVNHITILSCMNNTILISKWEMFYCIFYFINTLTRYSFTVFIWETLSYPLFSFRVYLR